MKISELLAEARDELSQGWEKHTLLNAKTGSVCAVGALRRATMNHVQDGAIPLFRKARTMLNAKAVEMADDVSMLGASTGVEGFNDWAMTSKQDVLNLFDKVIITAEETGN